MKDIRCVALVLLAITLGCENPVVCTSNSVYAVTARVIDGSTGAPAAFDATLVARDGQYSDSTTGWYPGPDEDQAAVLGVAPDRPGTYDVTIRKAGYVTWMRQGVTVDQGECHVEARRLDVRLTRTNP